MKAATVLLLRLGPERDPALGRALSELTGCGLDLACTTDVRDAVGLLGAGETEIVIVEADSGACDPVAAVESLRERERRTPIIVIAADLDDRLAERARRAGAQHVLQADEAAKPLIESVVRSFIPDPEANQVSAEEEMVRLGALSGPAPAPVTGRSLGVHSLREKDPVEFDVLLLAYQNLLEMVLERQARKVVDDFEPRLLRFAERLGVINAGPRDVVAIHKAAIAAKIAREPAMKTKAYCEEGRLLILQVMGHLVTFYRSLSWGKAPATRALASAQDGSTQASRT